LAIISQNDYTKTPVQWPAIGHYTIHIEGWVFRRCQQQEVAPVLLVSGGSFAHKKSRRALNDNFEEARTHG
jgi:hypothetical protein